MEIHSISLWFCSKCFFSSCGWWLWSFEIVLTEQLQEQHNLAVKKGRQFSLSHNCCCHCTCAWRKILGHPHPKLFITVLPVSFSEHPDVTTFLLFCPIRIGFLLIKEFGIRFLLSASTLFLVPPLHTSLTCYRSTSLRGNCAPLQILKLSKFFADARSSRGLFLHWPCHLEQSSLCCPPCSDTSFF